jgi:tryptophan-rich sensory protein
MSGKDFLKLIGFIIVCELAGAFGSVFTVSAIGGWYSGLVKPALNPPSWVFGPVWTILYALMGVAAFLVWRSKEKFSIKRVAITIFGFQLAVNTLWSILFFGLHSTALAFADIVILWCAIILTLAWFQKISKFAAYLLLPYLLWVTFAAYLNFEILRLN